MTISISESVYAAEDQLSRGLLEDAYSSALSAIKSVHDPQMLARGYSVLIQADFQCSRLTELEAILQQCGHKLHQLPVPTILLWGVVAVELDETAAARTTLERYLSDISTAGVSLAREDAMALSRLYAVQLLGSICHDFAAAASWVEAGGAGLSDEQQQLLLLELEEAEEVMQEERLAEWAAASAADTYHDSSALTAAAAAAASHLNPNLKGAAAAAADGGQVVESLGPVSPLLSPAADEAGSVCYSELGPSASGAILSGAPSGGSTWGVDTTERVDRAGSGLLSLNASHSAVSTPAAAAAAAVAAVRGDGTEVASGGQQANGVPAGAAAAAAAAPMGGLCNGQSCWNAAVDQIVLGQGTELLHQDYQPQPLAAAAAAVSQSADLITLLPSAAGSAAAAADRAAAGEVDRMSNSASPLSLYAWAEPDSSNHTQQQQQGPHETQFNDSRDTSAAVAATPLVAANGVAGGTGIVDPQEQDHLQSITGQQQQQQEQEKRQMAVDLPDGNAFCTMTGLLNDDDVSMPGHTADLPAVTAVTSDLRSSIPDSSSSSNSSRDQQDSRHDKPAVGAGNAADNSMGQPSAAAAGHEVQQQQQQSLTEWMSSKADSAWQSQQVQATLAALNLHGLEPWEVAGGAGALLLLGYGIYRKRRTIRRAAADVASSVAQTAQMALGMAINPMSAVPGTGHLSRP